MPTPEDPTREGDEPSPEPARGAPAVLRAVAVIAVVQGVATAALGAVEAFATSSDRLVLGVTTALFFVVYGLVLAGCGVALWLPTRWARGPVLFAQLVWLPLAWSLRSGATTALAVVLALSAVAALVCLVQPASVDAVERAGDRR